MTYILFWGCLVICFAFILAGVFYRFDHPALTETQLMMDGTFLLRAAGEAFFGILAAILGEHTDDNL